MPEEPALSGGAAVEGNDGRQAIYLLFFWVFCYAIVESAFSVLLSPYLKLEFDAGEAAIGAVAATFGVVSLLARLPIGVLYTPARGRRFLVIGSVLSAVSFALVPVAGNIWVFALLVGLNGLGWSIASTTQLALVLAWRPASMNHSSALSWYAGLAGLGHTSSAAAGYLADTIGIASTFTVMAALLGSTMLVLPRRSLPAVSADSTAGTARNPFRGLSLRGLPPVVWVSFTVLFYINFNQAAVKTFHPVLALSAGLSLTQIGLLASCIAVGSTAIRLVAGATFTLTSADASKLTTPFVFLGAVPPFFLPPLQALFFAQIPLFIALGFSRGLLRVTASAEAFAAIPDETEHGRLSGLLYAGLDLGKVAGPPIAGFLAQFLGIETMFRTLPFVILLSYLGLRGRSRRAAAAAAVGAGRD